MALLAVALALASDILTLGFIHDSPFHLRLIGAHAPGDVLFSSDFWRHEKNVFTPLFYLSLALDHALAGTNPAIYYVHHLLAVAGAALALYATLRLWHAVPFAFAGAALFLVGPAVAASLPVLMVRHYFEALLLLAAATATWVLALRRGRTGWAIGSAALFLAALLEKEIAAPLPLLLALAPEGRPRQRLRLLAFHAAALALYAGWRAALLPRAAEAYGFVHPDGWVALVAELPLKVARALFAGGTWGAAVALLVALACVALARRGLALAAVGLAAALLPVVPVSFDFAPRFAPRFALAAAFVVAATAAAGWARLASSSRFGRAALPLAAATLVATAIAGRGVGDEELDRGRRLSAESRGFVMLPAGAVLAWAESTSASLGELAGLRAELGGAAGDVDWFQDDLFLCSPAASGRRLFVLDRERLTLVDASDRIAARAGALCDATRHEEPLTVRFRFRDGLLAWELGPYADPGYSFVLDGGRTRIAMPARAGFRWRRAVTLRVRYASPAGWVTYSPPIALREGDDADWTR